MNPDESPAAPPAAQQSRADAIKMRALVATSLLVAILLVILQAVPPAIPPAPPPPSAPFYEREPEIRVRIGTLEPGQEVVVHGVDGWPEGVKVANRGGAPEVAGERCDAPCVMTVKTDGELSVNDRRYHGDLLVVREPDAQRVHLVNRLGIELYLEGVVLSEMPPDYPDEALFAQTVASRSYAAYQMVARKDRVFDVTDSQKSQVYKGAPSKLALARRIVTGTRGQVLTSDRRILEGVFSSTCGGTTRSAEEAFGAAAPAPLRGGVVCGLCDNTQFAAWAAKVKRSDAGRALGLGAAIDALVDQKVHASGRLAAVTLQSAKGAKTLTGNQFRDLLGPAGRSTWITKMSIEGDAIVAAGRGFGHGVGMCQVGAAKLASAGRDHRAILSLYYPGATLGWLYSVDES